MEMDESATITTYAPVDNDAIKSETVASTSWISKWSGWSRFSQDALERAESYLLSSVQANIVSRFVNVRLACSKIYTITAAGPESSSERTPVVFIHGFASGAAMWAANIDCVAKKRVVHAFDLLGFGRSSRPTFSTDSTIAELQFVESMEDWRKEMNIDRFILVGHSFGGFLASSYTLVHPEHIRHLVLVDPWGFPAKPSVDRQIQPTGWIRAVATVASLFNPLTALRAAGPYGTTLIKKLRPDLKNRYSSSNPDAIYDYVYHCNAQCPSGEIAFSNMSYSFGWAKRPMMDRFSSIEDVPVTFIYGSKSWIDSSSGFELKQQKPNSYIDVQVIRGAGHHVYVDATDTFNKLLIRISDMVDNSEDITEGDAP